MNSIANVRNRDLIFYSIFLSLIFLFYKGYTFNSWDQAECLPQVYKLLDPTLYRNDFFMQQYQTAFTVRFYFVYFIYALSFLTSVPVVCFVLTVLSLFLSIYFFIKITKHFTESKIALIISPLLSFFLFFSFTVGGNQVQSNSMIPGTLSAAFAIIGIYLFLEKKFNLSFFILGVGTLFQPLVTFQVFLVLMPLITLLEIKHIGAIGIFKAILFYLLPASFMLAPIFYRQFFQQEVYDSNLYYEILYRFRNHLHYLPSLFPVSDYIKFFALVIGGFVAMRFTEIKNREFIYTFSALVLSGLLLYWLLLEVTHIEGIGKLQWFKTTVWVNAIACIALSVFIGNLAESNLKFNFLKWLTPVSIAASVVLLLVLLNSAMLPVEKFKGRYEFLNYKKSDLTLLHEWMEQHLPEDAVILCSPENTSLICEARRSQVVQYQAIIHEPFYMLPWYERFKDIYGVSMETADRKDVRKQAAEMYLTRNYKSNNYHIDYRIDDITTCKYVPQLGKVVHQSGNYILTEYVTE